MKCARLHLQERRSKVKEKPERPSVVQKPRRFCQKRLINPDHEEDPRWMDLWDRFHCNENCEQICDTVDGEQAHRETEDMVLTVQTLKFEGDIDQTKRPRTSFKYKTVTDGNRHRMFVKQIVTENDYSDDDRSSLTTCYYFDDYVKYLCSSDRSRPTSGKSSIFLRGLNGQYKENKATQVEYFPETRRVTKFVEPKLKILPKKTREVKEEIRELPKLPDAVQNTKITYEKTAKRKSLTISRAQSPETVQVIRVDVVCNYPSNSMLSDYEETKNSQSSPTRSLSKLESFKMRNNHFANKYLLTNTIKTLDESLSGGSKVTLLCKTFKLSDRSPKGPDKPDGKEKKHKKKSYKNIKKR